MTLRFNARAVLTHAVADMTTAADGQLRALAGAGVAYLTLTQWQAPHMTGAKAKKAISDFGTAAGLDREMWQNYIAKLCRAMDKVAKHYGDAGSIVMVREANDAPATETAPMIPAAVVATDYMVAFLKGTLNVSRPHHLTRWAEQEGAGALDLTRKPVSKAAVALNNALDGVAETPATAAPPAPEASVAETIVGLIAAMNRAELNAVLEAANARAVELAKLEAEMNAREAATASTPVVSEPVKATRAKRAQAA